MDISFNKKWEKFSNESVTNKLENKLLENIKPNVPLKPKIEDAQKKLQLQISKLESISNKIDEKDHLIFKRIVYAMQNHDNQYAKVLSNELSQIRKMNKMITSAQLAMEQVHIRLNTITELGDIVVTLGPAMSVIKRIQGGLSTMVPEADQSFVQISDLLNSIMTDSGNLPSPELNSVNGITEDSIHILEEASMVVAQSMKNKLPDLPSIVSDIEDSTKSETSIY